MSGKAMTSPTNSISNIEPLHVTKDVIASRSDARELPRSLHTHLIRSPFQRQLLSFPMQFARDAFRKCGCAL